MDLFLKVSISLCKFAVVLSVSINVGTIAIADEFIYIASREARNGFEWSATSFNEKISKTNAKFLEECNYNLEIHINFLDDLVF